MGDVKIKTVCTCSLSFVSQSWNLLMKDHHQRAVANGLFVSHCSYSDAMRYVGGSVLNNPVTRASQSRERGRIPRARWLKIVWDSAMRWHGSEEEARSTERTVDFDHGKAVLCSNIHQRGIT